MVNSQVGTKYARSRLGALGMVRGMRARIAKTRGRVARPMPYMPYGDLIGPQVPRKAPTSPSLSLGGVAGCMTRWMVLRLSVIS